MLWYRMSNSLKNRAWKIAKHGISKLWSLVVGRFYHVHFLCAEPFSGSNVYFLHQEGCLISPCKLYLTTQANLLFLPA